MSHCFETYIVIIEIIVSNMNTLHQKMKEKFALQAIFKYIWPQPLTPEA